VAPISWAKVASKVKIAENFIFFQINSKISQTRQSFPTNTNI
jgi:hypothetical protein